jgi:hypothetical protein
MAATVGLPLLLESCVPSAPATPAGTGATRATDTAGAGKGGGLVPTYLPFPNKPKPDFPAPAEPYLDGYLNYPKDPLKAITTGAPGSGGTVTSMTIGLFPPPTPFENGLAGDQ